MALGALVMAWRTAQEYWVPSKKRIPIAKWSLLSTAQAVIDSGLAVLNSDGVYVAGSEEQFAWLFQRAEAGKKGGKASAAARKTKGKNSKHRLSTAEAKSSETNPLTLSLSLSSSSLLSSPTQSLSQKGTDAASPTSTTGLNQRIWQAYGIAYHARYGVDPSSNATVNSQVSQLAKRLGEDAVDVVRFYLAHNGAFYVRCQHTVGPMLKDAEALHTQWKRGQAVLGTQAREVERQAHNSDVWDQAAAILNERRRNNETV